MGGSRVYGSSQNFLNNGQSSNVIQFYTDRPSKVKAYFLIFIFIFYYRFIIIT